MIKAEDIKPCGGVSTVVIVEEGAASGGIDNANLAALAGLVSAADKLPYFTGAGAAALADLSSFVRTLLPAASAAAARAILGVDLTAPSDPSVAYVRSDGNDSTGTIGAPTLPYLTMQAAYDDGARVFDLGVGTFAGITTTGNIDIAYRGRGRTKTIITLIRSTNAGNLSLYDAGGHSAEIVTASAYGAAGADDTAGQTSGEVLVNGYVGAVNAYGGAGGAAVSSGGGAGGVGGQVNLLQGAWVGAIYAAGGEGGDGDGTYGAGNGGSGGYLTISGAYAGSVSAGGGSGGYGNGSTDGNGGLGGTLIAKLAEIGSADLSAGANGGTGSDGSAGNLTGHQSTIGTLTINELSGSAGSVDGACLHIETIDYGSPTISAVVSRINGTTY